MIQPLVMILVCLVVAYLLSDLFKRVGLPKAVGQIITGLLLGVAVIKSQLFTPENMDLLSFLANLGVILLFYYVGLETNLSSFTRHLKKSALISVFNTFLPLIIGFVIMHYGFGFSNLVSFIIGVSLSVSAQSVSLSLLEELKMVKSKIGSMIITAGAVDDIIELVMTAGLLSLFHVALTQTSFSRFVLDMAIFVLVIVVARIWLIPTMLHFFDREKSTTIRFMGSLIVLLLIASLSDFLGVGVFIGAMIAGMMMRQTIMKDVTIPNWEEHDIAKSIHIIAFGFLIPLFFVWVGLNTDVTVLVKNYWLVPFLFIIASLGTIGGTFVAVLLDGGTVREGLLLGLGLNPKGDLDLILAALALKAGIITLVVFSALVFMSLLTMIFSPMLFRWLVLRSPEVQRKE